MKTWSYLPLGECGQWFSGGTPSTDVPGYWGGDIPWITASSLHSFQIETSERTLTELGLANGSRIVPEGSILFVVRGMSLKTEFRVGIARRPVAFGQDCKAIIPNGSVDPSYLAYAIRSKTDEILGLVDEAGHGTGRLQTEVLKELEIPLPSRPEQCAIAHVLGTLDDKIELNRRTNETLEAIARALFKSWFVDFDPVRAKAEGRDPGLTADLADLFPDRFEDSETGEIPAGWSVATVDESFRVMMGQSPPGNTYNSDGDGLPFYQGRVDFGVRFPGRRIYCSVPTRIADAGDTLVTVRAPVGDVNMAVERCCIGRGVASVRHRSGARSYTYYAMAALREDFAVFEAEGTVFGSISKRDFHNLRWIVPEPDVLSAFESAVAPLDELIEAAERQSATLTKIRDALLPMLISGEIRLVDVERFAPEAA